MICPTCHKHPAVNGGPCDECADAIHAEAITIAAAEATQGQWALLWVGSDSSSGFRVEHVLDCTHEVFEEDSFEEWCAGGKVFTGAGLWLWQGSASWTGPGEYPGEESLNLYGEYTRPTAEQLAELGALP